MPGSVQSMVSMAALTTICRKMRNPINMYSFLMARSTVMVMAGIYVSRNEPIGGYIDDLTYLNRTYPYFMHSQQYFVFHVVSFLVLILFVYIYIIIIININSNDCTASENPRLPAPPSDYFHRPALSTS